MIPTRRALLALPTLLPFAAGAQAPWQPSRQMRLIVPFSPGGSTDVGGRIIAERTVPFARPRNQETMVEPEFTKLVAELRGFIALARKGEEVT